MSEQKRSSESTHYDPKASPTRKKFQVTTPPSVASSPSAKNTSSGDNQSSTDLSSPESIPLKIKKTLAIKSEPPARSTTRPSPEEGHTQHKEWERRWEARSEEQQRADQAKYIIK